MFLEMQNFTICPSLRIFPFCSTFFKESITFNDHILFYTKQCLYYNGFSFINEIKINYESEKKLVKRFQYGHKYSCKWNLKPNISLCLHPDLSLWKALAKKTRFFARHCMCFIKITCAQRARKWFKLNEE